MIRVWAALLTADLFRVFGGMVLLATPILVIAILIGYYVYRRRIYLFRCQVNEQLPIFEKRRRQWLINKLSDNANFTTHCFECLHFNENLTACSLFLPGRRMKIPLSNQKQKTFCLYWNVNDEPLLLHDDPRKEAGVWTDGPK